jgi:HSP20 family protein
MSNMLEPFDAFTPLREAVSRVFDEGLVSPERLLMLGRTFPVDILDRADEYVIEASLTGVKPENVHISTSGNAVTIRVGGKVHARHEDDGAYLKRERIERRVPEMSRTLTLPTRIDPNKIVANYEHGVLTITIAKDEETKPHMVPLHVAKERQ